MMNVMVYGVYASAIFSERRLKEGLQEPFLLAGFHVK